jgi:quercetin dioxygenase-like cupin family protein
MNVRKLSVTAVATVLVGVVYASSAGAAATPPAPVPGVQLSGTLDDSGRRVLRIAQDRVDLKVKRETTVTTFDITYPAGSTSGWHSHAGIVIAVVRSGSVVRESGCDAETFGVGDAFYEVGPHQVSNPDDEVDAVLSITRIYPTELAGPRTEEAAPQCP